MADDNAQFPSIKPPNQLSLGSNPLESWKLFHQRWKTYTILSRVERQPREFQVALLTNCLDDDALRVLNGFTFATAEDVRTVKEILDQFELFAVGEINDTYERFVFNRRSQDDGEKFWRYSMLRSET